jgi:hypothetical protein
LYEGANTIIPIIIKANNIWLEFTSTLWARLNHIKAKANNNWWVYRDKVRLVPKTIASQKLEDIAIEQTALLSLFLEWECPRPFKAYNWELITPGSQVLEPAEGHTLPHSYSSFDINWKIRTTPKPTGKDMLDVKDLVGTPTTSISSSSSGSAC